MKRIFLLSIAIMMAIVLGATERSEQDAAALAAKFFTSVPQRKMATASSTAAPMMRKAHTVSMPESKQPALYVFNRMVEDQAQGYAVVAAVEGVDMILGYSETGAIDEIPAPMQMWLEAYAEEIAMIERGEAQAKTSARTLTPTEAISPLMKTTWDQNPYYNYYTPKLTGSDGEKHCPTGCVATALGQIMKYWKYANTGGKTTESYYWEKGSKNLSVTLADSYAWSSMPNKLTSSSTDAQKQAVGRLLRDVGYACKMQYEYNQSGAQAYEGVLALIDYFGYDKSASMIMASQIVDDPASGATSANKSDLIDELIYEEMKAGRPVLVSATDNKGGAHAFVCDGIDANGKFHINWGWNGTANGNFLLSALKPTGTSYDYYYHRYFFTHIVPAGNKTKGATGYHPQEYRVDLEGFSAKVGGQDITSPITLDADNSLALHIDIYRNTNIYPWPAGSTIDLQVCKPSGEVIWTTPLITTTGVETFTYVNCNKDVTLSWSEIFDNVLAGWSGYYILRLGYTTNEEGQSPMPIYVKLSGYDVCQFKLFAKSASEGIIAPISATSTYDGSLTASVSVPDGKWQLVAFPYANQNNGWDLREYDGEERAALGTNGWKFISTERTIRGKGYILKGAETLDVSAVNADPAALDAPFEEFNIDLQAYAYNWTTNRNKGWNLVGNPYPASYEIAQLNEDGFTNALTFYNIEKDLYEGVSPVTAVDEVINAYEGFFVQVGENTTIPFRVAGVDFVFNSTSAPARKQGPSNAKTAVPSVKLYLGNENLMDRTEVVWYADATEDYDINYDGNKWFSERTDIAQVYTVGGDAKYAVNVRPEAQEMIAVGMVLPKDGEYTFSAVNTDMEVYLYDARFDISHDITKSAYTFDGVAGTDEARFALIFGHKLPTDLEKAQITNHQLPIKRVVDGQLLIINPASAHVYNAQGQIIR